jgi:hypothetical protein
MRTSEVLAKEQPMDIEEPAQAVIRFETKVALVLRADLAAWQTLNVAAFLASGIAGAVDDLMGQPYEDADGTAYLPLCRQPITILEADGPMLSSALGRALDRQLQVAVYTEEMFVTTHDDANRAAVKAVARNDLNLVGIGVYGPRGAVDKALKSVRLHP